MPASYTNYLNHIATCSGYRANWEPNRPLEIGMVGLVTNGIFDVQTSLQRQGLKPDILNDIRPGQLDYTSGNTVSIQTKVSGEAPIAGSIMSNLDAGFIIELKSANAVVFKAENTLTHQIENMAELEPAIIDKFNDGTWKKDWVIITQLQEATSATIIILNSSNSKIELKANGGVATGELKLTDASLGLSVAKETGSNFKFIAQNGINPLYRVMGIRHPLFSKPGLRMRKIDNWDEGQKLKIQHFDVRELREADL